MQIAVKKRSSDCSGRALLVGGQIRLQTTVKVSEIQQNQEVDLMSKQFLSDVTSSNFLRRVSWLFGLSVIIAVVFGLVANIAPTSARDDDDDACSSRRGPSIQLPTTKLFIEHNSTAEDTGVHGAFDSVDWQKLCVYDPNGRMVLEVEPKRQLRTLSISGIFFESREPPNDEVSIEQILAMFPEGRYSVRGRALDGRRLTGAATFTHDIPSAPVIVFPQEDGTVSPDGFAVMWNHVTTTLDGEPLNRTGYEVIVTKDVPDDPNGFSRPTYDVHVPPSETSLTVPSEFLEPGTRYELEVLVLEVSGNQTITSFFFQTQ